MERITEIINSLRPGANVTAQTRLLDEKIISSLTMMSLIAALEDEFDVEIGPQFMLPENFDTVADIYRLVQNLSDEA